MLNVTEEYFQSSLDKSGIRSQVADIESVGEKPWLWAPYVLMTTIVLTMLGFSFASFHKRNKERYQNREIVHRKESTANIWYSSQTNLITNTPESKKQTFGNSHSPVESILGRDGRRKSIIEVMEDTLVTEVVSQQNKSKISCSQSLTFVKRNSIQQEQADGVIGPIDNKWMANTNSGTANGFPKEHNSPKDSDYQPSNGNLIALMGTRGQKTSRHSVRLNMKPNNRHTRDSKF